MTADHCSAALRRSDGVAGGHREGGVLDLLAHSCSIPGVESVVVRAASVGDAPGMAAVHVQSWQETYRGLVADAVLDNPDFVQGRERDWVKAIAEAADGTSLIAVAVHAGVIIGIASAGEPRDDEANWPIELFVIYVLADFYGSGTGARLLDQVIADRPAALWVADPNPRAQAFYRKHGFRPDGAVKDDGIPEIRMVRPAHSEPKDLDYSPNDRFMDTPRQASPPPAGLQR